MQQLGVLISGEFLDLFPATEIEIEEPNPYLQNGTDVTGPFSLPFEVPHTERNIRLLGLVMMLTAKKIAVSIPAIVFENGVQHSHGVLKVEAVKGSLNDLKTGSTSLYYLIGSSAFYDGMGDKKLSDLDFGGVRTFAGLTPIDFSVPYDIGAGFGAHIIGVMNGTIDDFDYAFSPVLNEGWVTEPDKKLTTRVAGLPVTITENQGNVKAGAVNNLLLLQSTPADPVRLHFRSLVGKFHNPIVPFPYMLYVIRKIFENAGWQVSGDIFSDPDFKKIVLLSFRDIPYATSGGNAVDGYQQRAKPDVSFDLRDYMPTVTVSEFLIAIKDRFGLYYDFSIASKTCVIRYLRDVVQGTPEDITTIADPVYSNKIDLKGKVFALAENFDPGDAYPGAPDRAGLNYLGEFNAAPPTSLEAANEGKYYLNLLQNHFYIIRLNEDHATYGWQFFADNIYNYLPPESNETITTAATPVAQKSTALVQKFDDVDTTFTSIFPVVDQAGVWRGWNDLENAWKIRLLFYHGLQPDAGGYMIPYASNHPVNNGGEKIGNFSLSYESNDIQTGAPNGVYDLFWKDFLKQLLQNETITIRARYPFSKKNAIDFGEPKIILFTKFFVKTKRARIPYGGSMEMDLIRV